MAHRDREPARRSDDRRPGKTAAPPIEREHETQAGIFEEDERRERERERGGSREDPDDA
jgi:hypothetical protein